ncbi:hypothetical protein [Paraburkholderia caffeinilytica]|jgi:hypothetical protein|uniref:Uncharacterized protein n=1 Tax=Paraburkholderia caffeinilytica TaxID=1761016 RepID=A0ABQ1MNN7_9BURK|nr:hypothetical protein [Paraburkholderia caffeinilytica]GGC43768.1 hypothetical protein GCM10011400_33480 [Paraburkholderia caffeinilytica]CAB3790185.1 hypothetical protein LMG28690_03039 [Paraburkholderia caffeinilytica]
MKYPLLAALVASLGIGLSGAANAVNVDINIGTPAPVVVAPVVIQQGWHGDRYWDGHRYWEREEWEEHHHHHGDHDHCPPGHAKKGEC